MINLSANCKITKVQDHTAAGTSQIDSDSVDMAGYDSVMFITSYGTAAADNLMEAGTSSDDSAWNDLIGTSVGAASSDEDQWLDIKAPLERYIRAQGVRGTSSTLESIWAIQYNPRKSAVDNATAGTIHGELHLSPAEGTA